MTQARELMSKDVHAVSEGQALVGAAQLVDFLSQADLARGDDAASVGTVAGEISEP